MGTSKSVIFFEHLVYSSWYFSVSPPNSPKNVSHFWLLWVTILWLTGLTYEILQQARLHNFTKNCSERISSPSSPRRENCWRGETSEVKKIYDGRHQINDTNLLVEPEDDDEGEELDADFVQFGIHRPTWKWMIDLYWVLIICRLREFLIAQVVHYSLFDQDIMLQEVSCIPMGGRGTI